MPSIAAGGSLAAVAPAAASSLPSASADTSTAVQLPRRF